MDLFFIVLGWFIGGFVNGLAGFGAAMVAMPLIAPFIELSLAVPSCVIIVLLLNCHVGWTFRRHIEYRYLKGIFFGAVVGAILSIFVLDYIAESSLKIGMGAFITLYALSGLLVAGEVTRVVSPAWGYLAGMLSSSLGMAFGFNGPPLAVFVACCGCPAKAVKGTLGGGFIITGLFIVIAKASTGLLTADVLLSAAAAAPAVILGSKLGIRSSSCLSERVYRKVLFVALATMGLNIIWSAIGTSTALL